MHTYKAFLKGVLCIEEKKIPLVVTILILPYPKVMRGEGCQYAFVCPHLQKLVSKDCH